MPYFKTQAPDDYLQRIQQLLDQLGLKPSQFTRYLNVTATTVRNCEANLVRPFLDS